MLKTSFYHINSEIEIQKCLLPYYLNIPFSKNDHELVFEYNIFQHLISSTGTSKFKSNIFKRIQMSTFILVMNSNDKFCSNKYHRNVLNIIIVTLLLCQWHTIKHLKRSPVFRWHILNMPIIVADTHEDIWLAWPKTKLCNNCVIVIVKLLFTVCLWQSYKH